MDHIKISINDFQFNKKEALFLERHVWDKYINSDERQVSHTTRLMIADLAMHSALVVAYDIDTASDIKETFALSTDGNKDFFVLTIGEPSNIKSSRTDIEQFEMTDVLAKYDSIEINAKGKRFGYPNGISSESILHPLRCFLIGMQNKLIGFIVNYNDEVVNIRLAIPGNTKFVININFIVPK